MKQFRALVLVAGIALIAETAAAQDNWGSIAFSWESGGGWVWGMALGQSSRSSASNKAINECRSRGGSYCEEIGWFDSPCGGLAVGDDGYGYGYAGSRVEAESLALAHCQRYANNCIHETSRCAW